MSYYSTVTYNTDVEVNISDVISAADSSDLINELSDRGYIVDILNEFDVETLTRYVESRGGFTLVNATVEDLQGALEAKGIKQGLPDDVLNALNILFDYFNSDGRLGTRLAP